MPGAAQPGQAQHPNLTLLQPPKTFCSHLIFPPKKIGISLLWSSPSSLQPAPGISSGNLRAPIAAHTNCSRALLCSAPLPLQQNMDFPVKYPNSSCSGPLRSSSGRITNVEQGIWFFLFFLRWIPSLAAPEDTKSYPWNNGRRWFGLKNTRTWLGIPTKI